MKLRPSWRLYLWREASSFVSLFLKRARPPITAPARTKTAVTATRTIVREDRRCASARCSKASRQREASFSAVLESAAALARIASSSIFVSSTTWR